MAPTGSFPVDGHLIWNSSRRVNYLESDSSYLEFARVRQQAVYEANIEGRRQVRTPMNSARQPV